MLVLIILVGCSAYRAAHRVAVFDGKYGPVRSVDRRVDFTAPGKVSFYDDVQPILERRCDVCHSCYDAPCQLKLTCFEGLERGGSKKLVYDSARLKRAEPTRLYMDFLRMEGENNFLSFLPKDKREEIRAGWYKGARAEFKNYLQNPLRGLDRDTGIVYSTDDPKKEFIEKMLEHAGPAANANDYLNRCPEENCVDKTSSPLEQRADLALRKVTRIHGPEIQVVPDVTFIHIVTGDKDNDLAYTVIRNKALSNISFLFGEDRRRIVDDDTLTLVKGHVGSYPNAFCRVHIEKIEDFVEDFLKIRDQLSYYNFAKTYAVKRTSPNFWEEADWHYKKYLKDQPIEAGLFDMYRFRRVALKSDSQFKW